MKLETIQLVLILRFCKINKGKYCITNHRQNVKIKWFEKDCIAFHALKRDLPKAMKVGTASFAAF